MTTRDRKYWHTFLDQALDRTAQGRSFLPQFVELVLQDAIDGEREVRACADIHDGDEP